MIVDASIVSLGSWNSKILTPAWVSQNVFSMPDGESMNITLNEAQLNLAYEWRGIFLQMSDSRIQFKTNSLSATTLALMEACYHRLSEILCYTPISAVGYNLNITFEKDEFQSTLISSLIKPLDLDEYVNNSQKFSSVKDGVTRSFVVNYFNNKGEIRANFHYPYPSKLPSVGAAFNLIASEFKKFLGYELSLK